MSINKKIMLGIICGYLLVGISLYSPNLTEMNAKADTTSQNSNQGEIIVHYVDQSGNQIKPETVAKGATGTTYVASIPKISGYSYSSIENGQNNANGPQMVFGGGDSSTDVMSMTIVYSPNGTSGSNKSGGTAASNNNSGSNKSITNSASNSGSNSSSNKKSGNNTSADNASNSNKSGDDLTSKDNDSNGIKDNNKNKSNDKSDKNNNKKDSNKKEKSNKNKDDSSKDNHLLMWIVSGFIAIFVIIVLIWKWISKKSSFKH